MFLHKLPSSIRPIFLGNGQISSSLISGYIFFSFSKAISSLSASMDGTMLLSGSADCMVKLWHVDSRQCLRTFSFKGEYYWLEQKIDDEDARAVFFRSSLVIVDVFFALTLSCLVLTKDHTYLPKPAAFRG